jgi:hypothetical protein
MEYKFSKIAVLPNLSKDKELVHTRELVSYLEKNLPVYQDKIDLFNEQMQ